MSVEASRLLIGYSVFDTGDECYEYTENVCFIASTVDGAKRVLRNVWMAPLDAEFEPYMAECRALLPTDEAAPIAAADAEISETPREHLCPNCNIPLRVVSRTNRPGWFIIMNSSHRPDWYNDG